MRAIKLARDDARKLGGRGVGAVGGDRQIARAAIEAAPIVRLDVVSATVEGKAQVTDRHIEGNGEGSDVGGGGERVSVVVEASLVGRSVDGK